MSNKYHLLLRYPDDPDYARMEELLRSIAREQNVDDMEPFDWDVGYAQVLREDNARPLR